MSVKLPDIEWDCRLTCRDPKGMDRIIATTVSAMTTDGAYALCERMARNCNYTIIASTIVATGKASNPTAAVPWSGGSTEAKAAPPPQDAFPLSHFSKTTARPVIKYGEYIKEAT